jgi:hypothetical protein
VLFGDAIEHDFLPGPHFQPVTAVGSLQEEDVITRKPEDPLDWGGNVLVQAVRKFNDDYRAAPRRAHQATSDNATTFAPKLP